MFTVEQQKCHPAFLYPVTTHAWFYLCKTLTYSSLLLLLQLMVKADIFFPNNHNQTPVKKQALYKIQRKFLHVCTTEKMFEFFVYYTVYSFENFHLVQRLQILCLEALDLLSASTGSYEFPPLSLSLFVLQFSYYSMRWLSYCPFMANFFLNI